MLHRRVLLSAALVALGVGVAAPVVAEAAPPAATATFKVTTVPAGSEAGWEFTLVGPGTPAGGEKKFSTGTAATAFATPLQAGFYTVAQTTMAGWDQTGASGCTISVAYPADAGRTFACTVTDTREGKVTVAATHGGAVPQGSDAFGFTLAGGPAAIHAQQVANAADKGSLDFGQVSAGTYTLCQQALPSGWVTSLVKQGGIADAAGDICLPFTLAPGETRAFAVDTTSPPPPSTPTPGPSTPTPSSTAPATPAPPTSVQGVRLPATGSGVAVPNTGAGSATLLGSTLVLCGLGAMLYSRRRRR